jgi:hypothetical protein
VTDGNEPTQHRSRLETELLEILERADKPPSNVIKFKSEVRRRRYRSGAHLARLAAMRETILEPFVLLGACLALAIVGALIHGSFDLLGTILGYASIVLLALLFATGWRSKSRGQPIKRWRGRDIDLRPPRRFR